MTPARTTERGKGFDELRKQVDADPARRARVEEHKTAMLGELRRKLGLTQVIVAERLDVTQENISQIERGEADVRLSTLSRYVEALGGRLEIRATFPEETVSLSVGAASTMRRRRRTRALGAAAATGPRTSKTKRTKLGTVANRPEGA
jgi:transcriptional regulator with XRE-family HTH domain